jgi:hypothetical protein
MEVKTIWVKFWLKSNRGTDVHTYRHYFETAGDEDQLAEEELDAREKEHEETVEADLVEWCGGFYAWNASSCNYGWEEETPPAEWFEKEIRGEEDAIALAMRRIDFLQRELGARYPDRPKSEPQETPQID